MIIIIIVIIIIKTNLHKLYTIYTCIYIQVTFICYFTLTLNWLMMTKWYKDSDNPTT